MDGGEHPSDARETLQSRVSGGLGGMVGPLSGTHSSRGGHKRRQLERAGNVSRQGQTPAPQVGLSPGDAAMLTFGSSCFCGRRFFPGPNIEPRQQRHNQSSDSTEGASDRGSGQPVLLTNSRNQQFQIYNRRRETDIATSRLQQLPSCETAGADSGDGIKTNDLRVAGTCCLNAG